MIIMLKVLLGVYVAAVNVYSFMLLKMQRDSFEEGDCENAVHDGKLFIVALLGGAAGIYAAMFALKYRRGSMFLMVVMPVLIVLNGYLVYLGFASGYGLYAQVSLACEHASVACEQASIARANLLFALVNGMYV